MTQPHPSAFSTSVLEAIELVTRARIPRGSSVLDPFAGIGLVHRLGRTMGWETTGVELEPEWAAESSGTVLGDATKLPFPDGTFDATVVSPCYGNRMSDHHDAEELCKRCGAGGMITDANRWEVRLVTCHKCGGTGKREYKRITYKHTLNRRDEFGRVMDLHPRNAGQMQFGAKYQVLHEEAWAEATRVTRSWFVLNVSDHIRKGKIVPVAEWHLQALRRLGWVEVDREAVDTPRNRYGANRDLRVENEWVVLLGK